MAARTGASVGVAVTITLLGLVCLTLFVLTMVFYGRSQAETKRRVDAEQAAQTFIAPAERDLESVRSIADKAGRQRESVVAYLVRELRDTMNATTGNAGTSYADLRDRMADVEGADANPLMDILATRDREIASLEGQLAQAQADFDDANRAREALAAQVNALGEEYDVAATDLRGKVNTYAANIDDFQDNIGGVVDRLRVQNEDLREASAEREREMQGRLDEVRSQNLVLQDQIRRLRGEGRIDSVRPLDEASLVDGRIDRVDAPANEVVLSIGRGQKVVLGMTFAVYSDPTEIRPDAATGIYAPGKAVVEVTRVEPNFARARIISEARGNPIVRGDVVANAVYDPSKTYRMAVFGLFDRDRDGIATRGERDDVEALIESWGGEVVGDIQGDVDFLVLGERPELGPPPSPDDPIETVLEYTRVQEIISNYDEMLATAQSTSVPVLNENRLRTLIGDYPD